MLTVRERLKRMVDEIPEELAVEFERVLLDLRTRQEEREWSEAALALFATWFDEDELDYSDLDESVSPTA